MAISAIELEDYLRASFPQATIQLKDLVGDQDHYELVIIDASFEGKSLLAQHQMINKALKSIIHTRLHALTIRSSAFG